MWVTSGGLSVSVCGGPLGVSYPGEDAGREEVAQGPMVAKIVRESIRRGPESQGEGGLPSKVGTGHTVVG